MANTIGFGQASVNNTIDYGQGAIDNTINWGKSQTLSPSGETNITGTPSTPSFSNTQSILLDGIDDFVDIANPTSFSDTGDFTISAWIKYTTTGVNLNIFNARDNRYLYVRSGRIYGAYKNSSGSFQSINTTAYFNDGNWHHAMFVKNSTNLTLFVDGSQVATNTNGGATQSTGTIYARIGARAFSATATNFFQGNVDELAFFNSDQSANISTIWNGGSPSDINSLSPSIWYRCGDGDTAPTLTDNGTRGDNGTMQNFSTFSTDVPT